MPPELILYIGKYAYFAIFALVFLQEIGVPNPIPNELVLLFSGYLTSKGILYFPLVILAAVLADFIGTSILHTVFFFSGAYLLQHKPHWLPLPIKIIIKLKNHIINKGQVGIYIGRLTPFIRGYTSVIARLLQIKSGIFLPIALITAFIWATIYVTAGKLLGPLWIYIVPNFNIIIFIMILIFTTLLFLVVLNFLKKRRTGNNEEPEKIFHFKPQQVTNKIEFKNK